MGHRHLYRRLRLVGCLNGQLRITMTLKKSRA
jgi:hypothetical protein